MKSNTQIAKPIFIVEGTEISKINSINNVGYYEFYVKNYDENNISEIGFNYVIEIVTELNESIKFELYKGDEQIELKDYMWDIFPVGWDKQNPERLIIYAYAFTKSKPLFLGTWSIDYNEEKSMLISIESFYHND